jgi:hypothetical protein
MKQIYAASLALLAASAVAPSASALDVKFTCPNHSEQVSITARYYSYDTWNYVTLGTYQLGEDGTLTLQHDADLRPQYVIEVDEESDYIIDSVTGSNELVCSGYSTNGQYGYAAFVSADSAEEQGVDSVEFTIDIKSMEEKYHDKFYLTIDDPEQADIYFAGNYRTIKVTKFEANVESPVLFNSEEETGFYVYNAVNYTKGYYKVFKNGEELVLDAYTAVPVSPEDHITIQYNYPDVKFHVSFDFADEVSKESITGVSADDDVIENFADGFDAQAGSTITITGDKDMYNYTKFEINGVQESYLYFPVTFLLKDDSTVAVTAEKYATYTYTVNIDDPSRINFYRGASYNGNKETLVAGENHLEISASNTEVQIEPKSGCTIESIQDADGNELYAPSSWSKKSSVYITDGMVLNITTSAINRDKKFVMYYDDPTYPKYGNSITRADYTDLEESAIYNQGYTVYDFYDGDNAFMFSFYGVYDDAVNNVYVNDVKQEAYNGAAAYQISFNDGDILKLYFKENPEFYNVSFELPETGVEVSAVKDIITEASLEGFQALTGTQVDLTFVGDPGYQVFLNDEEVEVVEDAYSFNVNSDCVVKVVAKESGVSSVSADSSLNNIYNLQGIKVGTNRNQLPAGIYIVNGKKIAVK